MMIAVLDADTPHRMLFGLASLAASLVLGLVLGTIAALPYGLLVVDGTIRELLSRGEWFAVAGEFFLPGTAHLEQLTWWDRLGSASLLAGPIGATLSLPVIALLLLDECEPRASGFALPLIGALTLLSVPLLAIAVEPAASLLALVPLAALGGYWGVWRWRTAGLIDRNERAPLRLRRIVCGFVLAVPIVFAALVEQSLAAESGNPFITVRDRWLLPSTSLRPLSDAYYRNAPLATAALQRVDDPFQFQVVWLHKPRNDEQSLDQARAVAERLVDLGFASVIDTRPPPSSTGLALVLQLHHDVPSSRQTAEPLEQLPHLVMSPEEVMRQPLDAIEDQLVEAMLDKDTRAARIGLAHESTLGGLPIALAVGGASLLIGVCAGLAGGVVVALRLRRRRLRARGVVGAVAAVCLAVLVGCLLLLDMPTWWHVQATVHAQTSSELAELATSHSQSQVRSRALRRLMQRHESGRTAVPWATRRIRSEIEHAAVSSTCPVERLYATALCGLRPGDNASDALARSLRDPVLNVRYIAANALGHLGDPRSLHHLETTALDENEIWYVRLYAYYALLNRP